MWKKRIHIGTPIFQEEPLEDGRVKDGRVKDGRVKDGPVAYNGISLWVG